VKLGVVVKATQRAVFCGRKYHKREEKGWEEKKSLVRFPEKSL
jgi:hypothetical protein